MNKINEKERPEHIPCSLTKALDAFHQMFKDCDDLIETEMYLGRERTIRCQIIYIEIAVQGITLSHSQIGTLLTSLSDSRDEEVLPRIKKNALGLSGAKKLVTFQDVSRTILAGDAVLFVDGFNGALKLPDRGYPNMGITECEAEKVSRGSKEGFADSIKANTALLRKRLRTPELKIKQTILGEHSNTLVNLVYLQGIARESLLREMEKKLASFEIDAVTDTGILEQLTEGCWYSPFPQFQTTERPDLAVEALLEGRIVLLSDNSPVALILPTDFNCFLKTSDDRFNRFEAATFSRWIRYFAAFFALSLPGLYLAAVLFQANLLPLDLLLSFSDARAGVPFSPLAEMLLMELSFELLREAGIRLPGNMGNTMGIVGGLIIGQAAVEANLVSPIVVIVTAFTALCSFAIPNEEFAFAFRMLKYVMMVISGVFGWFGFCFSLLTVWFHLTHLKSFGIPFLTPFAAGDLNHERDLRDSIFRAPIFLMKWRSFYAREGRRRRYREKTGEKS